MSATPTPLSAAFDAIDFSVDSDLDFKNANDLILDSDEPLKDAGFTDSDIAALKQALRRRSLRVFFKGLPSDNKAVKASFALFEGRLGYKPDETAEATKARLRHPNNHNIVIGLKGLLAPYREAIGNKEAGSVKLVEFGPITEMSEEVIERLLIKLGALVRVSM